MDAELGSLIIDLDSFFVTPEEKELLQHPHVSGVILFKRNYENRAQLTELCQQIRAAAKKSILIVVDQEGGRVQRFKQDFAHLPPLATFGELYDKSPEKACETAKHSAWLMASELLSSGVDLSLAPVVDLNNISEAIGDRAFHRNPDIVTKLATHYIAGMHEAGMSCVIKHFPGHGSVAADSHHLTPVDNRTFNEIAVTDLLPFKNLINLTSAIMVAHIAYPNIDNQIVSYSKHWLQTILRQELKFEGVIMSDDLNMHGASGKTSYAERFIAAKQAGCDFVLLCNNRKATIDVIDNTKSGDYLVSYAKFLKLKANVVPLHHVDH